MHVQYGCENQSKVVYCLGSTSTGSVPGGNRSVTSSVTSTQNVNFGGTAGKEVVVFFQPNFQDIILAPSRADWNTQRWSWGHLKKTIFFHRTPYLVGRHVGDIGAPTPNLRGWIHTFSTHPSKHESNASQASPLGHEQDTTVVDDKSRVAQLLAQSRPLARRSPWPAMITPQR